MLPSLSKQKLQTCKSLQSFLNESVLHISAWRWCHQKRQITESHHNWSHRVRHDSTRSILSKAYWDSEFSSWPSSRSSSWFRKLVPLTNHCKSRFEVAFVDMSVEEIVVCGFGHLKFFSTCVLWSMNGQRKHSVCSSLNPCSWGGQPTRILFGDNLAVAWIGVRQTMCTADMWLSFSTLCHPFLCWSFPFGVFSYVSSISSKYASIYVGLVSAWLVLDLWHSTAHCIQLVSSLEFMWQHGWREIYGKFQFANTSPFLVGSKLYLSSSFRFFSSSQVLGGLPRRFRYLATKMKYQETVLRKGKIGNLTLKPPKFRAHKSVCVSDISSMLVKTQVKLSTSWGWFVPPWPFFM